MSERANPGGHQKLSSLRGQFSVQYATIRNIINMQLSKPCHKNKLCCQAHRIRNTSRVPQKNNRKTERRWHTKKH